MNRRERRAARKRSTPAVAKLFKTAVDHHRAGQLAEADRHYRQILAIDPDHVDTLQCLGLLARQAGRNDLAITLLGKAVTLNPNLGPALDSLAAVLFREGNYPKALAVIRRALAVNETEQMRSLFVECVTQLGRLPPGDDIRDYFVRALSEPWARPSDLAPLAAALIKRDGIGASSDLATVARHRVLRTLLESAPVCDIALERCLTTARAASLGAAQNDDQTLLDFACALARQCFINEYVFAYGEEEFARALELRKRLVAALNSAASVPPLWVAIVACYMPLHSLPRSLVEGTWPDTVAGLLIQQVHEPAQEREERGEIPRLTSIDDQVSRAVQQQYEENPYPRWVKIPPPGTSISIDAWLRGLFPHSGFRPLGKTSGVDILIAGCGTGQQTIEVAQGLGARVLAVDLSLASLAYALRKTRELGLQNVEYAQADLLALGSLGRTFDVIEATGSLQALAAPMTGWRVLLDLLRPGGLMKLGLYSELARASVVAARIHIAERGFGSGADDIRRCRQELLSADDPTLRQVTEFGDFYTISNCRDLLFHVQEHRFTLPEIAAFLAENGLRLLGFELDPSVLRRYAKRFPDDKPMTDLAHWHVFETANPKTFMGMYQFWVQKRLSR